MKLNCFNKHTKLEAPHFYNATNLNAHFSELKHFKSKLGLSLHHIKSWLMPCLRAI